MTAEEVHWRCRDSVLQWNRLYPIGTAVGVRLSDGSIRESKTRGAADVFETSDHYPVAAVYVEGWEPAILLEDLLPEIPNELQFLLEKHPAEEIRAHLEEIRDGLDLYSTFFKLAKHWEYEADKADEENAIIFRRCAKQLRSRAEGLRDTIGVLKQIVHAAPGLIPK